MIARIVSIVQANYFKELCLKISTARTSLFHFKPWTYEITGTQFFSLWYKGRRGVDGIGPLVLHVTRVLSLKKVVLVRLRVFIL